MVRFYFRIVKVRNILDKQEYIRFFYCPQQATFVPIRTCAVWRDLNPTIFRYRFDDVKVVFLGSVFTEKKRSSTQTSK